MQESSEACLTSATHWVCRVGELHQLLPVLQQAWSKHGKQRWRRCLVPWRGSPWCSEPPLGALQLRKQVPSARAREVWVHPAPAGCHPGDVGPRGARTQPVLEEASTQPTEALFHNYFLKLPVAYNLARSRQMNFTEALKNAKVNK